MMESAWYRRQSARAADSMGFKVDGKVGLAKILRQSPAN